MSEDDDVEEYELEIDIPQVQDVFEPEVSIVSGNTRVCTSYYDRLAVMNEAIKLGFEDGTIVTKASFVGYMRTDSRNWGIVTAMVHWEVASSFAPIKVSWLDGTEEYYFPEDLILVAYAPDDMDLEVIRTENVEAIRV